MPRTAAPSESRLARLRRYFGLSQQELAALLGISTKAVETRIRRARAKLAELLDG